jgi:hypothetical protein
MEHLLSLFAALNRGIAVIDCFFWSVLSSEAHGEGRWMGRGEEFFIGGFLAAVTCGLVLVGDGV